MKTMIAKSYLNANIYNELYAQGYRYLVEGDYKEMASLDPWSGMPMIDKNHYAFDNKDEAEAFALTQYTIFSKSHPIVEHIPEHTETMAEWSARFQAEKAAEKAKRDAKDTEKATALGFTLEEYRAEKQRQAKIRRMRREIERLENELAETKAKLEKLEG